MSNTFTPPTHDAWAFSEGSNLDPSERRFWAQYGAQPRGKSLVRVNGSWTLVVSPDTNTIAGADLIAQPNGERVPGVFLGGHEYPVTDIVAEELEQAGYTVTGYTVGGYAGGYAKGY